MKTTLNNFQPFKICIGVHFPSRTWFPKFIKMTLRLFVILNSFTYIMLWSRFYNLCQYTPLLTAHQELQKLVLSWSFREKMSRLRLEMNVRCLKKNLPPLSSELFLLLLSALFKKKVLLEVAYFISRQKNVFRMALTFINGGSPVLLF